ncbi:hypothetical protein AC1031_009327 [Aphanomyces cochlioides]|nr:hypothetical protein AC1031_009327 [Aphanomyces cochlioides]
MTISSMPYISRSLSLWSTRYINSGWWTDMSKCVGLGATMIRNATNSIEALGRNWDTMYTGTTSTVGGDIFRSYIGPFMNWDTKLVNPPSSLLTAMANFQAQLYSNSFQAITESDIDVVPANWGGQGMLYYGGNPLCALITPSRTYVQMPFTFEDACQRQDRLAITFSRPAMLFSMWMSQPQTASNLGSICNLSPFSACTCNNILASVVPLATMLTSPANLQSLVQDVQNPLFIQLASRNTSKLLLTQPIIPNIGDP